MFVVAMHVPIVGLSVLTAFFGWPMLLMPVHILFLQLIIDPTRSVVFEAEPLEVDAMKAPPRRHDQRLFDRAIVARGLCQGAGLLLLLLTVYAGGRAPAVADGSQDNVARALAFVVLVLSNLGLNQSLVLVRCIRIPGCFWPPWHRGLAMAWFGAVKRNLDSGLRRR